MIVTQEDLRGLIKKLDMNIQGLKHKDVDSETRINVTIASLTSLKHHIENNIHKVRD